MRLHFAVLTVAMAYHRVGGSELLPVMMGFRSAGALAVAVDEEE